MERCSVNFAGRETKYKSVKDGNKVRSPLALLCNTHECTLFLNITVDCTSVYVFKILLALMETKRKQNNFFPHLFLVSNIHLYAHKHTPLPLRTVSFQITHLNSWLYLERYGKQSCYVLFHGCHMLLSCTMIGLISLHY